MTARRDGAPIVLVDQDGVLADWDAGFRAAMAAAHPDCPLPTDDQRREFHFALDVPAEWRDAAWEISLRPGFYRGLTPIPGAVDAVREMADAGIEVFVCTAPLNRWEHCVGEKYGWVEEHLGPEWIPRVVLTRDKTLVHGDVLIDDRPEVVGVRVPAWEHVLYDAPYNRAVAGRRRTTWATWRATVDAALRRTPA